MSLRAALDAILNSQEPLGKLDSWLWQNLSGAVSSKRHPWNSGAFSTIDMDASGLVAPRTRTVILRGADRESRSLTFFTDVRSAKMNQLRPEIGSLQVCWLFYRPSTKLQLRLDGNVVLVDPEQEERAWKTTPLRSRAVYASIEPPGLVRPSTQPPDTSDREITESELERGRENFRVIRSVLQHADVLYLRSEGHVRAKIDYLADGKVASSWLVP